LQSLRFQLHTEANYGEERITLRAGNYISHEVGAHGLFYRTPYLSNFSLQLSALHKVKVQDKQFTRYANYKFHVDPCHLGYDAVLNDKHRHYEGDCFLHRHGQSY